MADEPIKTNGDKDEGKVSKDDHDKVVADFDKAKQDLEDMRMEVLTPDYLDYLNNKDKPQKDDKPLKDDKPPVSDDDLSKLSRKELVALAKTQAKAEMQTELDSIKKDRTTDKDARVEREIREFGETHDDFKTYRPIMYGMSLDPKYKNASLDKLYAAAKEHVKGIHAQPSEDEINRQKKGKGFKPGGDNSSYEKLEKMSTDDSTKEAVADVEEKLGPIPSA